MRSGRPPNGSIVDDTLPAQEIKTPTNRRRADRTVWIGLARDPIPDVDVPAIAIELVGESSRVRRRDYGEVYRTPLLPGFELPLERILNRADRYT